MPKKDEELMRRAALLMGELNGTMNMLFERLNSRAGDAWQFRAQVEDITKRTHALIKDMDQSKEPEPEPTVGLEEEE